MEQFIESSFSWPTWPASVLLLCVCGYWTLMVFGVVDLDFLDLDLNFDVDSSTSILEIGFVPLRFLNLGSVPTNLWLSVFALTGWMVSRLWNSPLPHPTFNWPSDSMAILRDGGVAAALTKIITQPLRGRFDPVEPNRSADLVGKHCVITTTEVTETFGEAELATDGAPLRLKVRNDSGQLKKGDFAVIVDVQTKGNTYFVEPESV
ncbi:MAG: hypothetical protein MK102_13075 [Fuerstiella sp.]|nr:hypothetical protein [Fuerstiella sp.]